MSYRSVFHNQSTLGRRIFLLITSPEKHRGPAMLWFIFCVIMNDKRINKIIKLK